jgi:hypothetical protein
MTAVGGAEGGLDDTTVVQAFGALSRRLNDALAQARQALAPHAKWLPDGALADIDTLLAEFARRRVRVAIYGEVKAGKSTLLNAIAGRVLSPVAFDPLTSVPLRVTYGDDAVWRIGDRRLDSLAALERFMRVHLDAGASPAVTEVVAETNLDLLQLGGQVDLLDTPGVGSAAPFDAVSADALRALDAVILVVRYPALFTEFTRRLMDGLRADIGKLFVVWNLDADCAELTADERVRHAATLRANVAGAHELHLVDARAGFRAMAADDAEASVASGLSGLIAGLRRFVSSGGREVTALREAAKRTHQWLARARERLDGRRTDLDAALHDARARLQAVRDSADAEATTARGRVAAFHATVGRIVEDTGAATNRLAAQLRTQLRRARWRWVRRADYTELAAAMTAAIRTYADAVHAAHAEAVRGFHRAAADVGATVNCVTRDRIEPAVEALATPERIERAASGRAQLLRRVVWHRWYTPGLAALERVELSGDLRAQGEWLDATAQAVRDAGRAALDRRLAEIARRADAALEQIRADTHFAENLTEHEQLTRDLPILTEQGERVTQLAAAARALL